MYFGVIGNAKSRKSGTGQKLRKQMVVQVSFPIDKKQKYLHIYDQIA